MTGMKSPLPYPPSNHPVDNYKVWASCNITANGICLCLQNTNSIARLDMEAFGNPLGMMHM